MKLKKEQSVRRLQGKLSIECEFQEKEGRRRTGKVNKMVLREREKFIKVEMREGGERKGIEADEKREEEVKR